MALLQQANTEQLEKLQYRALRIIVISDFTSSYAYLLEKAELSTLHLNRIRCIAAETYKCINNLTPEYIMDLVQLKTSSYTFRYENTVKVPTVRTVRTVTYGQCSFRFDSARVWNSLPNDMRKVTNLPNLGAKFAPGRARAADVLSDAVREVSQHISWFIVIFCFKLKTNFCFACYFKKRYL